MARLSLILLDVVREGSKTALWVAGVGGGEWVAQVGIPGTLVALLVFLLVGRGEGLVPLPRPSRRVVVWTRSVAMLWLSLVLAVNATTDIFIPGPCTPRAALSFLGFGVVAEEFLFHGAIYGLVATVVSPRPGRLSAAVWVTAALFASSQFQYYGYEFTSASVQQATFAFPFGVLFGFVRRRTGTVWAAIGAHMLMNFPPTVVGLWAS